MELFDYQSHHVIHVFIKNQDAILWHTKPMRANADECVNVEVAVRQKGVGWILRELAGNKQTRKELDAMNVNELAQVPKTATLAPSSTLQPGHMLNLGRGRAHLCLGL
jgi:pre-mRNA-splicing helicase BRR2